MSEENHHQQTNKEIIDEIIDKQSSLNLNDSGTDDDNFVDCIDTPLAEPDQPDELLTEALTEADEASQRDYESKN